MNSIIAGVDEAGRGPLAGPVFAAAVILAPENPIHGLADSKKLTEKKREDLYTIIQSKSLAWAIGRAEVLEIDSLNILQATLLAMQRAVGALAMKPDHVQVDGNQCPSLTCSVEAVVRGDQNIAAISAASILAKVARDRVMLMLDAKFPGYGFARHKGYGTKQHMEALRKLGPCQIHRKTFAPIKYNTDKNYNNFSVRIS